MNRFFVVPMDSMRILEKLYMLRPIEKKKKLPKKEGAFSLPHSAPRKNPRGQASATFSQHKLGEGWDEGGRLSRYEKFYNGPRSRI
jgi:hypothetical protein